MPQYAEDLAHTFLEALFGPDELDGYILIWTNPGKRSAWFRSAADAARHAASIRDRNVYVGLGLSPEAYGNDKRCLAQDITAISGVRADIDIAGPNHAKPDLPPDMASVRRILDALPLKPTLITHTGGGVQAYWLFKERLTFENDVERQEGAALVNGWNRLVASVARTAGGWSLDATHDLARVFRVAGSVNVKDPDNPRPVTIIEHDDSLRYNPEDIQVALPGRLEEYAVQIAAEDVLPIRIARTQHLPMNKLDILMEEGRFKKLFYRKPCGDLRDKSMSGYDMALACACAKGLFTDQEIADTVVYSRSTYAPENKRNKAFSLKYVSDTIKHARDYVAREEAEERAMEELGRQEAERKKYLAEEAKRQMKEKQQKDQAKATAQGAQKAPQGDAAGKEEQGQSPAPEESREASQVVQAAKEEDKERKRREAALTMVSERLGVPIIAVYRYPSDPPEYALETPVEPVHLGTVEQLIRLPNLQRKIAEKLSVLIPSKIKGWDTVAGALLASCIDRPVGEDGTMAGQVRGWIRSYLDDYKPAKDWENAPSKRTPFIRDGRTYIFVDGLREFLAQRGEKIEGRQLTVRLKSFGCECKTMSFTVDGKPTSRSVWFIPEQD